MRRGSVTIIVGVCCTLVSGCSGSSSSAPTSLGGAFGTGGSTAGGMGGTGGTQSDTAVTTGGQGIASTGGTLASGGGVSTGGVTPTGGSRSSGGASVTGGTQTSGGSVSTGGAATGGAATSTGGSTGSGDCAKFSFFVTSQVRLFALAKAFNGSDNGFGGDLRYGETGTGAGLRGADKICTAIAGQVCPSNAKTWHAFISVSNDGSGAAVNAIDRVGTGPWYDRMGRLVSQTKAGLQGTRPTGANAAIINDLPNEEGVNNHAPNGTLIDNHNVMTGSDATGRLASSTGLSYSPTCKDWTDATTGSSMGGLGPYIGNSWWDNSGVGTNAQGWIYNGHNAAGCQPGAIDPTLDCGFGVGEGCVACATVGCMGGYGGLYCFAVQP